MPKGVSKKGRGKGGRTVQKQNDAPKHDEKKGKAEKDGEEWEDEDNDVAMMDCEEDYDYIRRAEEEEPGKI